MWHKKHCDMPFHTLISNLPALSRTTGSSGVLMLQGCHDSSKIHSPYVCQRRCTTGTEKHDKGLCDLPKSYSWSQNTLTQTSILLLDNCGVFHHLILTCHGIWQIHIKASITESKIGLHISIRLSDLVPFLDTQRHIVLWQWNCRYCIVNMNLIESQRMSRIQKLYLSFFPTQ